MRKRFPAAISVFLLAAVLFACGSGGETLASTDDVSDSVSDTATTEESLFKIPREDNDGRDFTILVPTDYAYEFPEETDGEVMNDILFDRNAQTEDYFGINIICRFEPGHWDSKETYNKLISEAVLAGDSVYDLTGGMISCTVPAFMQGIFADINQYPDIDLDNPWWFKGLREDLSINRHLWFVVGDASISVYKNAVVTYFNKQVLEDHGLEDPYALTREGSWTMEKLLQMSEAVLADLNGDSVIKPDDDRIGCYLQDVPLRLAGNAFDVRIFDLDSDGKVVRNTGVMERLIEAYGYTKLFFEVDYLYDNEAAVDFMQIVSNLAEDRALFHISYLYVTESDIMRNMKSDFGILPYPKLNEEQESHITPIATSTNLLFIPLTASDIPLTCRVAEAFGYFNMTQTVPAYYEVALQEKYTRDNEVRDMLSLIRGSMRLSFDCCYGTTFQLNGGMSNPGTLLAFAKKDMASFYESKVAAWDVFVEKLNAIE